MPTRFYLDSNCLSYCLTPRNQTWTDSGVSRIRERVIQAARSEEIIVLGSQYHIEEASRIPPSLRSEWMRLFWEVVRWNFLRPTDELSRLESELRRGLHANEPFEDFWYRQAVRTASLRDSTKLDEIADAVRGATAAAGDDLKHRRGATKLDFKTKEPNRKIGPDTDTWWADPETQIADWIEDFLSNNQQSLNLPGDKDQRPKPKDLPLAWAIHAYLMARMVMTVGKDRKILGSDNHDAQHYGMSTYADVIVTEDQGFTLTVAQIPNAKKLISFDDFAAVLGLRPQ